MGTKKPTMQQMLTKFTERYFAEYVAPNISVEKNHDGKATLLYDGVRYMYKIVFTSNKHFAGCTCDSDSSFEGEFTNGTKYMNTMVALRIEQHVYSSCARNLFSEEWKKETGGYINPMHIMLSHSSFDMETAIADHIAKLLESIEVDTGSMYTHMREMFSSWVNNGKVPTPDVDMVTGIFQSEFLKSRISS